MTRMKESGIDWIGQIPEEWEISKIRYLVTTRSEKRITDSSVPYIGLENIESQTGKFVETGIQVDKSENIVVEIGDILFGKLRPYLRKYWRATFTSTASSEFLVFQSSELDMNFLYYAIQSDSFIEEVNTSTYGSKMPRASWEYIKNMKIAFPTSLVEQQKIADFLDKKTAQLDKVRSLLEEQIQKLNAYRASLIYETVTKGLDKNVPMKDSGIDWIGKVPQGWGVSKLKNLLKIKDGTHDTPSYVDSGIPLITTKNINSFSNYIDFSTAKNISYKDYILINRRSDVEYGDILMPMIGTVGGAVQVTTKNSFSMKNVALFKAGFDLIMSKYLYYQLNSDIVNNQLEFLMSGGVQSFVSISILEQLQIINPSEKDKKKIVRFLDEKTQKIDKLIQIKNQQIENINKQRQTLIYDYVTGKRRV